MRGSLERPPIVIRVDRKRAALHVLVVALLAVLMSPLARTDWRHNPLVWLAFAIFGALALASAWELVLPGRLIVDKEGFELRDLWWRRRWSWSEARRFRPAQNRFYRFVGFDCLPIERPHRQTLVDGINQDWELSPPDLAALLNQARARWFR